MITIKANSILSRLFPARGQRGGIAVAPQQGVALPIEEMPDKVFSSKVLGDGVCILPENGRVESPINGHVVFVADTLHAIALEAEDGAEFMLHMGVDTVGLGGRGFSVAVEQNQKISMGDLLCQMDLDTIKQAGYATHTALILTNADAFTISQKRLGDTAPGKTLIRYKAVKP